MSEPIFNSPLDSTIMSNKSCYPPLIWYTGPIEDDMICNGNCCLSCPYMDNFYPENAIRDTFEIFAIFGIISFFLMVLLSMIFLLLPSQRNHTARQLLLPLALSVCYFEANWRDYDHRTTLRLSISEAQQTLTHITHIIRIQWRASFGALLMVTVYSVNWVTLPFIKDQIGSDWIQQWFQCLANGTQTTCSFYANDHVPSFSWIVTVLFFNRFCGIIIFILFIGKRSMLIELWHYITRKPRPISIHSITSFNEKRHAMIARNSIQKKRMSFSSILSIASSKGLNNTPVSTSLRSSLTAPYPTSILMDSKENYPFKVDKSSKRLTFSSFTSDNNYVIEPVKTRNSYVTIRYSDLLKSVQQNEPVYSEEELGEIIEKYKNYFDREKTSSLQNNATTSITLA
ncbi:787_t:CDS:2 [Gigaspora margarita]|uniref:787_t:CDS:1 n=1 Tax=Gigaspora margarita TaxID=4874 RepID=A0ABM8VYA1_GIGMA|nr:787_t:CDS:2 [Gigaspora margarita]